MAQNELERLRDTVVSSRLVAAQDFDECLRACGPTAELAGVLRELERRQLLTSYQSGLIKKGEIDGLVLGDFKLMYRNAAGSFARVFRACSLTDGSQVGIKLLRQRWAKDPQAVSQFRREALMLKRFKHPNIVPIYDVYSDGDRHYFTMEFVEGGNLRDFINIRKKLAPEEATQFILDIARGLDYALGMGATHRDLKMTNVLMSANGSAKLIDFGLAGDDSASGGSSGDDVQRALEYATLEKGTGAPKNDPRSDLFFLGAIFHELLTGQPPYPRTKDREERKQFSRYSNVIPVGECDPALPRCVTDIVDRLMKVDPRERFQRPSDVIPVLSQALRQLSRSNGESDADDVTQHTLMFVEKREKQQKVIKDYLGRHGFRVLLSQNAERVINRINSPDPPNCVILMGDTVGDDLSSLYERADKAARGTSCSVLAVMPSRSADNGSEFAQHENAQVLQQPLTLRKLREAICKLLKIETDSSTADGDG